MNLSAIQEGLRGIIKLLAFSSFFLGITYIIRFLLTFTLVKILSPDDFGYYSWVMSTFLFLSTLNLNGLDSFSLRKVAELKNNNQELLGQFQHFARKKILYNSFWNLLFLSFLFTLSFSTNIFGEMSINFMILAIIGLALPFSSFTMVNSANLRVNDYPRVAQLGDSFIQSFSLVFLICFLYFIFQIELTLYNVIYLYICSWIAGFFFTTFFYHRLNLAYSKERLSKNLSLEWKTGSREVMLGVFGWVILSRGDIFILGFFVQPSELSSYFISLRIAELMLFIPSVSTYIWSGRISNLYHEGDLLEAQRFLKLSSRLCCLVSSLLLCLGYYFSYELLNLFGESYSEDVLILRWSLFSYFIISSAGLVGPMLLIVGQQKFFAILQWSLGILFIITMCVVAPKYGIEGGVMLFCFFQLLVTIIMMFRLKKLTSLSTFPV